MQSLWNTQLTGDAVLPLVGVAPVPAPGQAGSRGDSDTSCSCSCLSLSLTCTLVPCLERKFQRVPLGGPGNVCRG